MEISLFSWDLWTFRAVSHGNLASRSLSKPKTAFLQSSTEILLVLLFPSSKDGIELPSSSFSKWLFSAHESALLACGTAEYFSGCLNDHWCSEVIFSPLQKSLQCAVLAACGIALFACKWVNKVISLACLQFLIIICACLQK